MASVFSPPRSSAWRAGGAGAALPLAQHGDVCVFEGDSSPAPVTALECEIRAGAFQPLQWKGERSSAPGGLQLPESTIRSK